MTSKILFLDDVAACLTDGFVLATGETYITRQFPRNTFQYLGIDWHKHVEIDSRYFRLTVVKLVLGDYSKAKSEFSGEHETSSKNWLN